MEISFAFPAGFAEGEVGSTVDNLEHAAAGEHFEWTEMYKGYPGTAREEGFPRIAVQFDAICVAEQQHEKRYNKLRRNIEDGSVFQREPGACFFA